MSYLGTVDSYLALYSVVGRVVKKTISETITLTTAVSKDASKTLAESITLTDSFTRTWSAHKAFTEKLTLRDAFSKAFTKPRVVTYVIYGYELTTRRLGDIIMPEDHNNKREVLIRLVERLREVVEEVYG